MVLIIACSVPQYRPTLIKQTSIVLWLGAMIDPSLYYTDSYTYRTHPVNPKLVLSKSRELLIGYVYSHLVKIMWKCLPVLISIKLWLFLKLSGKKQRLSTVHNFKFFMSLKIVPLKSNKLNNERIHKSKDLTVFICLDHELISLDVNKPQSAEQVLSTPTETSPMENFCI